MSIAVEIMQGTARDFPFQVTNPDGTTPTGIFLITDVLTAKVWAGSNEAALLTPTASWISATNAQYQISVENTASSSLTVRDLLPPSVRDPGRHTDADHCALATRDQPGDHRGTMADTPRPTYIGIKDLRKIAPWIDDLQVPDSHEGFDDPCADSRDWLDEMILRNYRGGNVSLLGYHGFALDAWYTGGGRRTSLTNRWLFSCLAANQLLVTPRVKNVCARTMRCRGSANR